ncbi:hypothetical protein JTY60_00740 [symbiont of Argiope bruennichi]|uniref:FtsX-like permease family protein n=1 Tax=symbiont of Argiope bruennichi TaxID=2810479 RepID=UPI003DA20477
MKANKKITSKIKRKFSLFLSNKLVLNKIRFQFARHEKIRIATNYFVLILGSFLMLLSFFVPSILLTFLYGSINSVKPYNSYVKYQPIPWNDFHGNMILGNVDKQPPTKDNWQHAGLPASTVDNYQWFNEDEKNIYGFYNTSPIYPTFLPSSSKNYKNNDNFLHYLGPENGSTKNPTTYLTATAKYFGGYLFDQNWLNTIGDKSSQSKIICQMIGSEKDNAGECIVELMSKKLPQYVFNKVISGDSFYPNSSISFGLVPFDPVTDNKFTYIESKLLNKNLEIWGVNKNFENSDVTNVLYKDSLKSDDKVINVVVNTAVQKSFNLKLNQEYPITFFQNLVENNKKNAIQPFDTHINMESRWDDTNANLICIPGESYSDCVSLNEPQTKETEWLPHYTYGIFNKNISTPPAVDQLPLTVDDSIAQKVLENNYNIIQNNLTDYKIKVVGKVSQISDFKVYAKQQDINNLIFANYSDVVKDKSNIIKAEIFKKLYFNGKFSKKIHLDDETNISFFNPYGDYTQQGLNGGKFQYPIFDNGVFNSQSISDYKSFSTSTVSDEWSHALFFDKIYQTIGGFSLLLILFTVLVFLLSFVIMLSCCNILIHDNKKQILIMKSLGYKNKEINSVTTGIFFITIIFSFLTILIASYILGYFLVESC